MFKYDQIMPVTFMIPEKDIFASSGIVILPSELLHPQLWQGEDVHDIQIESPGSQKLI